MSESFPDIAGFLATDATIAGLVATRIFPTVLAESAVLPAISYQVIDMPEDYTLDGVPYMKYMRLQINCWAERYSDVDSLTWAVRKRLRGFQGFIGGQYIDFIKADNVIDEFEAMRRQYHRVLDFIVTFNDSN